jgi:hypothetical protein
MQFIELVAGLGFERAAARIQEAFRLISATSEHRGGSQMTPHQPPVSYSSEPPTSDQAF